MSEQAVAIEPNQLLVQLERILHSRLFEKAQRSQRFLRYLVEAALANPPVAVKEYTAAIDIFDRDARYDPAVDATVRVEASRLRSRLREYYAEEGRYDPWLIEVPKGGYNVVFRPAPPPPAESPAEAMTVATAATTLAEPLLPDLAQPLWTRRSKTWAAGLLLLGLTAGVVTVWKLPRLFRSNAPLQVRDIVPITTDPGLAQDPAVSPDGTRLAYSWNGEDGIAHIQIKSLTRGQNVKLTHTGNPDRFPIWSGDGKQILFARFFSPDDFEIVRIPAGGGEERAVRRVRWGALIRPSKTIFAWTADHQWLCFPDQLPGGASQLFLLSPKTGLVKPLHGVPLNEDESSPAFSPNGQLTAFVRFSGAATQLVLQKLNAAQQAIGSPMLVSGTRGFLSSPVWLDDRRLLFLDGGDLMQASSDSLKSYRFYTTNSNLSGLTYDAAHLRLITAQLPAENAIWSLPLKGTAAAGAPKRFVESTVGEEFPAFSPDGRWLAFLSVRSGAEELWLADAEGHNPRQLTRLSAYLIGYPHWSRDSRYIVFHARVPRTPQLYLLRVQDNSLRKLTEGEPGFVGPSFSSDGKSVYCARMNAGGAALLFKVGVEGGSIQPLWDGGVPVEAPGRNSLVYMKTGESGIYERSLLGEPSGNPETHLTFDSVPVQALCVTSEGIYYSSLSRSSWRGSIRFYSFATRHSTEVAPAKSGSNVSVRPDGTSLAYDANAAADSQLLEMKLQ